jgi:hypothetical protein
VKYEIRITARRIDDDPGTVTMKIHVDREKALNRCGLVAGIIQTFESAMPMTAERDPVAAFEESFGCWKNETEDSPKLSTCCYAPLVISAPDESTQRYVCSKCGEPSDAAPEAKP